MNVVFAIVGMLLIGAMGDMASAGTRVDHVSIRYVPPKNSAHQQIYDQLKHGRALEKLQRFLSPFRLPRTLHISLEECDGEPDAYYDDAAITVCYEYIYELWENMPKESTLAGVTPIDMVIGPLFEITLHEIGHALFDMLNLPVLGREEDAADQVAAYIMLQLGKTEARRLIIGTAHAYKTDEKRTGQRRSMDDYASEHGTPAQRAFNVLCIAYGADTRLFGDIVHRGYLPKSRAKYCEEEYEQIQDAFETLIFPHMDRALADKILDRNWLCKSPGKNASVATPECVLVPNKRSGR